jgi:hypothetical protein
MTTEQKVIVLQLTEHDAHKVLWLVQKEASNGAIWNGYWEQVAKEIKACIEEQAKGCFTQCQLCHQD